MRTADTWALQEPLRRLFDHLSEPLLLLDGQARVVFANVAATRALGSEPGMHLGTLRPLLGDDAVRWAEGCVARFAAGRSGARRPEERPPVAMLPDGRRVTLAWEGLDGRHSALRLAIGPLPVVAAPPGALHLAAPAPAVPDQILDVLWRMPFPATLQDGDYRIVDVNQAYLDFTGVPRDRLIGTDPLELQPEEDRDANRAARTTLAPGAVGDDSLPFIERRLVDAGGRERWFRAARAEWFDAEGQPLRLVVMQDSTAEHAARERADRSVRELDDWFDLSPVGMVLFDEAGLLVRTNPAFDALVGDVPPLLSDASPAMQEMLAWAGGAPSPRLLPGGAPVVGEGWFAHGDGTQRRLRSTVRCYRTPGGQRRHMAVVEDRTVEEERDLAQLQRHAQQQRTEQLLREVETILDSSTAGIAYLRGDVLVRCNFRFEAMLGPARGALAGSRLQDLFASAPRGQRIAADTRQALEEGATFETEFEIPAPPGSDAPARWYALSVRRTGPAQGPIEAIAVVSDVTRLKSAEQAVTLQAARTRAILDSVLVGIVIVGARGIEWMNRSARRMFGGDLADFIGQQIGVVATDDPAHPLRRTHYLDELEEGRAETFECEVKALDGRRFWIIGNAVATGGDAGRQLTYALLDIDRRRVAETRTAQAQASLQRIIEAAPMSITLRDAATLRVLQVNEVAARTVGRTPDELVGLTPEEIFDPATAAERRRDMQLALESGQLLQREYRLETDGEPRIWDTRYLPLAAPGQRPDQLLLVATEVTEQRAAQQAKLEAAVAQREMLVKEVHHRIKNNLQGVAGLLQQIAQRKPEVAPVISEVVGQVQAIAQVYGLQVGLTGPLRLQSVVEAITGSVQRTFGQPILLGVEGSSPQRWALPESESIPIALCVNELLANAVKHGLAGGGSPQVACTLVGEVEGARIVIRNRARLPAGFDLARFPGGVSGLGLVRSLLPRRSARLTIEQAGEEVVATVALAPPGIARIDGM